MHNYCIYVVEICNWSEFINLITSKGEVHCFLYLLNLLKGGLKICVRSIMNVNLCDFWYLFDPEGRMWKMFYYVTLIFQGDLMIFDFLFKEWERPKPGRRPDIIPQFSPMKTPLPPPMPYDPPQEDEEEEEKKEEEEEDPEKEEPEKPEGQ